MKASYDAQDLHLNFQSILGAAETEYNTNKQSKTTCGGRVTQTSFKVSIITDCIHYTVFHYSIISHCLHDCPTDSR